MEQRKIKADSKEIKDVRDTLEHMDEKIAEGFIKDGQPLLLRPTEGGRAVSLGPYTLH